MSINLIITSRLKFKEESEIKNSSYKNKYEELKNMIRYCCNVWNDISYAWNKIHLKSNNYDPRFYYQSIIFNLYMLGSLTKRIERDVLENDKSLKDLRDNIAHMDEKLKAPLNSVLLNDVKKGAIINNEGGGKVFPFSLVGLHINTVEGTVSTPLGIIENVIFSSLAPSEQSTYINFVSYEITEERIVNIEKDLFELLKKYLCKLELMPPQYSRS